jgi:hypothetical protein
MAQNAKNSAGRPIRERLIHRQVSCESCGKDYVYFIDPTTTGEVRSKALFADLEAEELAANEVRQLSQKEIDRLRPVAPCPHCGWIQKSMFKAARSQSRQYFLIAGIVVVLIAVLFLVVAVNVANSPEQMQKMVQNKGESSRITLWLIPALLFVAGFSLCVWEYFRTWQWDPNSQPVEKRLQLAQNLSLTMERYNKFAHTKGEVVVCAKEGSGIATSRQSQKGHSTPLIAAANAADGRVKTPTSRDYRFWGWFLVVIGPLMFLAGLSTVFFPNQNKIMVGFMIAGLLVTYRGIRYLRKTSTFE